MAETAMIKTLIHFFLAINVMGSKKMYRVNVTKDAMRIKFWKKKGYLGTLVRMGSRTIAVRRNVNSHQMSSTLILCFVGVFIQEMQM